MIFGFTILLLFCAAVTLGPLLVSYSPIDIILSEKLLPPSSSHWLGTDSFGTDILATLIFGARQSILIAAAAVSISVVIALILGTLASTTKKWVDKVVLNLITLMSSFPGFLLALSLVVFWGQGKFHLIVAFGITGWVSLTRLIRTEIQGIKTRQFVEAIESLGGNYLRIVALHIWPQLIPLLVVQIPLMIAGVLIGESSLTFLGLGVPPDQPSWGGLINQGRLYLISAPHICIAPSLSLMILIIGFFLTGDALRKKYQRH